MKSVIVVGAGLAGLSAGYRLQEAGWQVKVLESSDRSCGRVSTYDRNGYKIDDGPTAVSTSYIEYLRLMQDLGLADCLVESSNKIGFVHQGRVHEIDGRHPIRGFLGWTLLSWSERLQLIRGALKFGREARTARIDNAADFAEFDDRSMFEYLRARFSEALIEKLFDPLTHCFTYGDKREASCVEMFCGFSTAAGKLINVRGGLDVLPRKLSSMLDVSTGCRVTQVERTGTGVSVHYLDSALDGRPVSASADACVITAPFEHAVAMVPSLRAEGALLLAQNHVASTFAVYLGFNKLAHSTAAALALPQSESPMVPALFLDHVKAPDRAPPGHSLITVYYDYRASPTLKQWSEQDLYAHAQSTALKYFPELAGSSDFQAYRYFDPASHLAPVGYFKAVRQFLDHHSPTDPIQLAGDYFSIPSQETAVAWGRRAAQTLLAQQSMPVRTNVPVAVAEPC